MTANDELLPCPFCKFNDTEIAKTVQFWIICQHCGAEGPARHTKEDAIKAWNSANPPASASVDDIVDAWHKNPGKASLRELLGMTEEQYGEWLRPRASAGAGEMTEDELVEILKKTWADHMGEEGTEHRASIRALRSAGVRIVSGK